MCDGDVGVKNGHARLYCENQADDEPVAKDVHQEQPPGEAIRELERVRGNATGLLKKVKFATIAESRRITNLETLSRCEHVASEQDRRVLWPHVQRFL